MEQLERRGRIDGPGTVAILAAAACWTTGPVFIRYLSGHLDAWSQNLWRYTVAMCFWLPYLFWASRRGRVTRDVWKRALLPSAANIVMQCFWAWSFYYVEPGFGTLLSRTSVIWTAAFCLIYFPEERGLMGSKRFWTGAVLSGAGLVTIVAAREGFAARGSATGIVLMLSAAALWALYTILARIAFRDIDPRIGFSVVSVYTVTGLAVIALILGEPGRLFSLAARPWVCVVVSGILSISLAHTLYYTAIQRIGATIPAMVLQLSPFATLLVSMAAFGERLSAVQWVGGVVLIAGSSLSVWAQEHLMKAER